MRHTLETIAEGHFLNAVKFRDFVEGSRPDLLGDDGRVGTIDVNPLLKAYRDAGNMERIRGGVSLPDHQGYSESEANQERKTNLTEEAVDK